MNPSDHVTTLEYQGKSLFLVGTAHVSQRSVDEVRRVIDEVRPDTVCVELDQTRYDALVDDSRWRKLDIFQIIKQKKVLLLLTSLALAAYQRKLGKKLGVEPGAEMLAAVHMAKETGAEIVLADRDIQATLKRTWARLSFLNKVRLLSALVGAFFATSEISEEQIEKLKDRDTINEMLREFAKVMPQVKEPLIDERDKYLMSSIQEARGKRIVAIVGAGHIHGMVEQLGQPVDRQELSKIPAPGLGGQLVKWIIPAIVLGAFYYGYSKHSGEDFRQMLYAWIIPNCIAAALFSALAGARIITVAVAFVASPITSLNPTISAGMVAGLVEAWLRRPTVAECERINEDMTSLRGMYRNSFTRVLLVAVAATFGSALGAWIGATWVVTLL